MEVRLSCAILTILCSVLAAAREEIKNCRPPAVIKQARRTDYFQQDGTATLECIAKGDETLKYTWLKDGEELDPTTPENSVRMTINAGVGTLILSPAKESDEGTYQCKVQNPCGTSLSTKTRLLHAHIDPFPKLDEPLKMKAMMGKPLKLSCSPPDSVPDAQISWILVSGDDENADTMDYQPGPEEGGMFNSVPLGRRITMDYDGNLYFVAVEEQDAQDGKHYVCMAINNEVRSMNQGEDKIIEIFGSRVSQEPTVLQWHSDKEVMALEGRKARFKCIFSGYPLPKVGWRRVDGQIDEDRMKQSSDEHEFVISDVQPEDEGIYECSGANPMMQGTIKETFKLSVESRPRWTKRPRDMTVGVEDNVTVVCDVDATPPATVKWYINGVPEEEAPPARNRKVHNNALVFTNVTQDDSQVIQCNASNIHGYLWADVYMEVEAMRPTILSKPTEQKVAKERDIIIPCGVEGKPRPKVLWYKGSQKLEGSRYTILPNGDLQINSVDNPDSGRYLCIAKNRYGEAEAEGSLVVREKTQIVSPPSDDHVNYGEPVIFNCGAVTDKAENMRLKYIWSKDNKRIDKSDPRVQVKGGELRINATTSKDTGKYKCNATNGLDSDAVTVTLEVVANITTTTTTTTTTPSVPTPSAMERHDVVCGPTSITFSIPLPAGVTASQGATLSDPRCHVDTGNRQLSGSTGLNDCGTTLTVTNESLVFSNAVLLPLANNSSVIARVIPIHCRYNRSSDVTLAAYMPVVRQVLFTETGVGQFSFRIQQYRDATYSSRIADASYPLRLTPSQRVFMDISLGGVRQPEGLGMDVVACVASPSSSLASAHASGVYETLIDNNCPATSDVQLLNNNGTALNHTHFRFSFPALTFPVPSDPQGSRTGLVYVHCRVRLCRSAACQAGGSCPSLAAGGRSKRAVMGVGEGSAGQQLSTGPLLVETDSADSSATSPLVIVLGAIAACATLVAMTAIVAWQRSRRRGDLHRRQKVSADDY